MGVACPGLQAANCAGYEGGERARVLLSRVHTVEPPISGRPPLGG